MYSNNTIHYEIPLPQANDTFNPMDWNESSEKLDTAVYNAAQVASTARDDLVTAKQDIVTLQNGLDTTNSNATALTARVGVLEQNDNTYAEGISDLGDMITAREVAKAQSDVEIAVGKWFRYNGVLYVCTVEIKIGDTIVPNVNCRATNVESEMPTGSGGLTDRIEVLEANDVLIKNNLESVTSDVSLLKTTMGSTSISGIGEGTVTSAIASMNNDVEGNVSDIAEILVRLQALEEGGAMEADWANAVDITEQTSYTVPKNGFITGSLRRSSSGYSMCYVNGKICYNFTETSPQGYFNVLVSSGNVFTRASETLAGGDGRTFVTFVPFK